MDAMEVTPEDAAELFQKEVTMIFLTDTDLRELPKKLNCPKLHTLFLQRNPRLTLIPSSFFESMISLTRLNLSRTGVSGLPETLFKLVKLQALILRNCERLIKLSSEVGSLQSLEVLDLGGSTKILELPSEVGELTCLRNLEVSFYGSMDQDEYAVLPRRLIPRGTISKLQALQTLKISVYLRDPRWWLQDVNYVVPEISKLTKLSCLHFHFPKAKLLESFLQSSIAWKSHCFTGFKFVVGHDVKRVLSPIPDHSMFDSHEHSRCIKFVNGEQIPDAVLTTIALSTTLYLESYLDVRNPFNIGVNIISGLKVCIISECPRMKYVFRSTMIRSLCKLEQLVVSDCPSMEEIIQQGEIVESEPIMLPSLKKLTLHYLPRLVTIGTRASPSLEHVSLYRCPKLKNLDGDFCRLKATEMEIRTVNSWWDTLEWISPGKFFHYYK